MVLKIKTFGLQKNYRRYEKKFPDKILHLNKIYKFTSEHFLIEHVNFVSSVKNVIKNDKFFFAPNIRKIGKNCQE